MDDEDKRIAQTVKDTLERVSEDILKLPSSNDFQSLNEELSKLKSIVKVLNELNGHFSDETFFNKAGKFTRQFQRLHEEFDKLSNNTIESRISSIETELGSYSQKLDSLNSSIQQINSRIESSEERIVSEIRKQNDKNLSSFEEIIASNVEDINRKGLKDLIKIFTKK